MATPRCLVTWGEFRNSPTLRASALTNASICLWLIGGFGEEEPVVEQTGVHALGTTNIEDELPGNGKDV